MHVSVHVRVGVHVSSSITVYVYIFCISGCVCIMYACVSMQAYVNYNITLTGVSGKQHGKF